MEYRLTELLFFKKNQIIWTKVRFHLAQLVLYLLDKKASSPDKTPLSVLPCWPQNPTSCSNLGKTCIFLRFPKKEAGLYFGILIFLQILLHQLNGPDPTVVLSSTWRGCMRKLRGRMVSCLAGLLHILCHSKKRNWAVSMETDTWHNA